MRARLKSLLNVSALLLAQSFQLIQSLPCSAAPSPSFSPGSPNYQHGLTPSTSQGNSSTVFARSHSPINLNLSSTIQSSRSSQILSGKTVNINVGGKLLSVNANTLLTPAESLAASQVVFTGQQSLILNGRGSATGGTFSIGSRLSQHISSLVIPRGVTVTDFSKNGMLNLSGQLIDLGSLYLRTGNTAVSSFSINANNIAVGAHGLMSAIQTSGSPLTTALNLSLTANDSIVNAGTVVSGGTLNLVAGGSIINSLPQGKSGAVPLIQAAGNVALLVGSGQIKNNGSIVSTNGSINISTLTAASDLMINASAGTFQALNGNINFRSAAYTGANNITINGGNYLSQNLNLYSGTGTITGFTGQVSGNLNSQAGVEHFAADTKVLTLHNNTISGDPTFVNTGGDILINGLNSFTENVAILASGNITTNSGTIVANGFNVTLVAGAGLSVSSGGFGGPGGVSITGGSATPSSGQLNSGQVVTVNFSTSPSGSTPGGTGGDIDLTGSVQPVIIDTTALSGSGGNGGSITLAAFASGSTGGHIFTNTSPAHVGNIHTYGDGVGAGGNVSIYAGANPASSSNVIKVDDITTGGAGPGGNGSLNGAVNIFTAQPTGNAGNTVTFDNTGTIGGGQSIINSPTISSNAGISTGTITTAGSGGAGSISGGADGGNAGNVTIKAGGAISTGSVEAFGGGGGGVGSSGGNAGKGGDGGGITVSSGSDAITISGDLNASGGGGGGGGDLHGLGGFGGNSGNITVVAAGSLVISGIVLAASGGNGNSGGPFGGEPDNGGGGSFGGGGGAGASANTVPVSGVSEPGGGGMFGGGGGGNYSSGTNAAGGGGGGFGGSGGGGAADSAFAQENTSGGGGGGNGSTEGSKTGTSIGGSPGFGGGAGGTISGGNGPNGGNGGNGGSGPGSSGSQPDHGGFGGSSGSDQANFGMGSASPDGPFSNNAGTRQNLAGQVQLSGLNVAVNGTISGGGVFSGQSINAQGQSGQIAITSTAGSISLAGGLVASTVSLSATNGSIGTAGASQSVNGGGTGLSLYVSATGTGSGQGSFWITDNLSSAEQVTLANSGAALNASVSAALSSGNIIEASPGSIAIISPSVSLIATNGNIGLSNLSPLLIQSSSSTLQLFISATGTGTGSFGQVWITDQAASPQTISLNNSASALSATVSFSLISNGSIVANLPANTALISPNVILSASNGSIGTASTSPVLINNAGNNLALFASATGTSSNNQGSIWIADNSNNSETVTINNTATTPVSATVSFSLSNSIGDIVANSPTDQAINSPNVSLVASKGNLGTSGASQILLNGTAFLFASAGGSASNQGNVWISNGNSSITLMNSATTPLSATGSGGFNLTNINGSILINSPTNTAITAANINLSSTNGDIGTSSSNSLLINNGGNNLSLMASATATSSSNQGSIWISDNSISSETVTISNTAVTFASATVLFSLSNSGNIVANSPTNPAISSPNVSLVASNGNIGTSGGSPITLSGPVVLFASAGGSGSNGNLWINNSSGSVTLMNSATTALSATGSSGFNLTSNNGSIVAASPGSTAIISPNISLSALQGSIGSSASSPLLVNNVGAGISLFGSASGTGVQGNVWMQDNSSNSELVTLNNSSVSSQATVSFSLTNNSGSIAVSTPANVAISSPTINLVALGGNITASGAAGGLPLSISGSGGLALSVNASRVASSGGAVNLIDPSSEDVTFLNASSPIKAAVSFTFSSRGNILDKLSTSTAITSPSISLSASAGNIGFSTAPLIVSSGASGTVQLQLAASATQNTAGNGNVSLQDNDIDLSATSPAVLLLTSGAGSGQAVSTSTGNFTLVLSAGGIAVGGAVTASTAVTAASLTSVLQQGSGILASPSINLTATTGNIGASGSGNAVVVSSGASGSSQLGLTVNATVNTHGNGNIWITDGDLDVSSTQPALLLFPSSAGSGTPIDNTSGNFNVTQTGGSIGIHPTFITASQQIDFTAQVSIVQLHGETIVSPNISLVALTGNIGVSASLPLLTQASSLSAQAPAGSIWLSNTGAVSFTGSAPLGSVLLSNTGNITLHDNGTLTNSAATNYTVSAAAGANGQISLNGNVSVPTGTINLSSTGAGVGSSGVVWISGTLTADSVVLTDGAGTGTGNLGTSSAPIHTDTSNLTAATGGVVFVSDSSNSTVLITGTNTATQYSLAAVGSITVSSNPVAQSISLSSSSASGAISLSSTLEPSQDASGNGGSLSLSASNIVNTGASAIALSVDGSNSGNGGILSISTNNLSNTGGGSMSLSANGGSTGSGGSVSLSSAGSIDLTGAGAVAISATGINGGKITLAAGNTAGRNLSINSAALTFNSTGSSNGNGGDLSLSAGGTINIADSSSLGANGIGTGAGGGITLTANQVTYVNSGNVALSLSANGGTTGSSAGNINLNLGLSIVVGTGSGDVSLSATGAGVLSNTGQSPLNGVTVATAGNLTVTNAGINVGPGSAPNQNGGNVTLSATTAGASSGTITFTDTNAPTFNGASGSNAGTNGNGTGNGGYLSLNGATAITQTGSTSAPLILSANGGSSGSTGGSGGVISFETNSATPLNISKTAGGLQLSATGGAAASTSAPGASGGTIIISNGKSFSVDPAAISATPLGANGKGANLTFVAGIYNGVNQNTDANLKITSALSANGKGSGSGGSITLESTSSNTLNVGLSKNNPNGVEGTVSVSRGSTSTGNNGEITFINAGSTGAGGGVTISVPITAISQATISASGGNGITLGATLGSTSNKSASANTSSITLSTTDGNITQASRLDIVSASNIVLQDTQTSNSGGNIGSTTVPFAVATGSTAANLAANATGVVNISNTGKGILTVGTIGSVQSGAGASFALSSAGSITTNGDITTSVTGGTNTITLKTTAAGNIVIGGNISSNDFSTTTINLTAMGTITDVSPADTLSANTVVLNAGTQAIGGTTPATALSLSTNFLTTTTTGAVNISNLAPTPSSTLTLVSANSRSTFKVASADNILNKASLTTETGISLSTNANNGKITIENFLGSAAVTTIVSLSTNGIGAIILTPPVATTTLLAGKNINLSSASGGGIGTANSPFRLNASSSLTVTSTGISSSVNIQNTGTSAMTIESSSATSTFKFSSAGIVTTEGNIFAPSSVTISGASVTVGFGSLVGESSSNVLTQVATVTSTGAGAINGSSNGLVLASTSVSLGSSISTGAIGSSAIPVLVNTPTLSISTTGLVNIDNLGTAALGFTVGSKLPSSSFKLSAAGTINTPSSAFSSPTSITLASSGSLGDVNINGVLGGTKTATINLSTVGQGAINNTNSSTIQASSINLSSDAADIKGASGAFAIKASTSLSANSTGGLVDLQNTAGSLVTVNASSGSLGFTLVTAGSTTIKSISTVSGDISVTENTGSITGTLSTAAAADIEAHNGSITLSNSGTATTAGIVIGAGSKIITAGVGGKNVNINMGTPALVQGIIPANVNYNPSPPPASMFLFGTKGITVINPKTIDMVVIGNVQINFNTGTHAATAIKVNGGSAAAPTIIQADPPSAVAALNILQPDANLMLASFDGTSLAAGPPLTVRNSEVHSANLLGSVAAQNLVMPPGSKIQMNTLSSVDSNSGYPSYTVRSLQSNPSPSSGLTFNLLNNQGSSVGNLSGTNFSGTNFSGTNFSGTNFSGTNFSGPNLSSTNFSSTNLSGTNLSGTNLSSTNFSGTNLSGPNLSSTNSSSSYEPTAFGQITNRSAGDWKTEDISWISETELARGEIPATVSSDADLGISNDRGLCHTNGLPSSNHAEAGRVMIFEKGSLVFAPLVDSMVKTSFGTVKAAAGSLVLILRFGNGLAVYDLDDLQHGAVSVATEQHQFKLYPGMSVIVTNDAVKSFEQINPAQLFAYRNIATHELGGGIKAFSTEFSVPTAIQAVLPLKQLLASSHPNARRLSQHLLKTTAATIQMHGQSAIFQQVQRPSATAWAQ